MKRQLVIGFVAALCIVRILRHRVRRAGPLGGFRCINCRKVFASLDEVDGIGTGHVSPGVHRVFSRDGAGGHAEVTRTAEWGS